MRGRGALLVVVLAAALVAVSGALGRSTRAAYPFLNGYHLTGAPLALEFFDGGAAGRVAVLFEYNLKGIVPNSYAGVVTSSFHIEVQADSKRVLHAVTTLPRPGGTQPLPAISQLLIARATLTEQAPNSPIVDDVGTAQKFAAVLFAASGTYAYATGPHVFGTADVNGFQLSAVPKQRTGWLDFVVGNDHHKQDQPPLTPDLEKAKASISTALTYEDQAAKDFAPFEKLGGKAFSEALYKAKEALKPAVKALNGAKLLAAAATADGESTHASSELNSAVIQDNIAIAGTIIENGTINKKGENQLVQAAITKFVARIEDGLKRADKHKRAALAQIVAEEGLRAVGT